MHLAELVYRQQLGHPQSQQGFLTGPKPRPPPGLNIKEILNFPSLPSNRAFCTCKQGTLYGAHCPSLAFTLHLLCLPPSKHFHRQVSLSPFTDGTKREAQKVKGFNEGRSESQSRGGNRPQSSLLPGLSPAPSQAQLETGQPLSALPTLQQCANPLIFATSSSELKPHLSNQRGTDLRMEGAISQNQSKADGLAKTPSGGREA